MRLESAIPLHDSDDDSDLGYFTMDALDPGLFEPFNDVVKMFRSAFLQELQFIRYFTVCVDDAQLTSSWTTSRGSRTSPSPSGLRTGWPCQATRVWACSGKCLGRKDLPSTVRSSSTNCRGTSVYVVGWKRDSSPTRYASAVL